MRDRIDELGDDTIVALVTFTNPASLAVYVDEHALDFPVLRDVDRTAYAAFGLDRGSLLRVWGWQAVRRYVSILRAEGFGGLRRPIEDTRQLGGDFVIDADGRVAWAFWGTGPDDRPSVDDLIAAVTRAQSPEKPTSTGSPPGEESSRCR